MMRNQEAVRVIRGAAGHVSGPTMMMKPIEGRGGGAGAGNIPLYLLLLVQLSLIPIMCIMLLLWMACIHRSHEDVGRKEKGNDDRGSGSGNSKELRRVSGEKGYISASLPKEDHFHGKTPAVVLPPPPNTPTMNPTATTMMPGFVPSGAYSGGNTNTNTQFSSMVAAMAARPG